MRLKLGYKNVKLIVSSLKLHCRYAPVDQQGGHRVHSRGSDSGAQRGGGAAPPAGPDRDLQGERLDGSDQLVCSPGARDQTGSGETLHLGHGIHCGKKIKQKNNLVRV